MMESLTKSIPSLDINHYTEERHSGIKFLFFVAETCYFNCIGNRLNKLKENLSVLLRLLKYTVLYVSHNGHPKELHYHVTVQKLLYHNL